jgi:two-component system, chemotaxis family, protein-glutamate methylesterase/glutaminase
VSEHTPVGVPRRVVGIGASAGGVDALVRLVRLLPADLDAAVCVVLHIPAAGRSLLAPILARHSDLEIGVAEHDAPLEPGRVYVAPADRHLTVADGRLQLDRGPKENAARPAVDPLLRSLAAEYGALAVGVVLSGALGDGTGGAVAIAEAGGTVIVQDPNQATMPSMPESARRAVGAAAEVRELDAIAERLVEISRERVAMREDVPVASSGALLPGGPEPPSGPPTALSCPECHGPLWELDAAHLTRYQCRVGHAYSEEALVVAQGSAVESALWSALEALEERAEFLGRLAARFGDRPPLHERHRRAARDALDRAELIRRALGVPGEAAHALDIQAEAAE